MTKRRIGIGVAIGVLSVALYASVALADTTFDDGEYTLTLPGIGDFEFEVTDGGTAVDALGEPDDYVIDDDDPEKAAWKDTMSLNVEVEAKVDKVEATFDWGEDGEATLALPGGGSITVTEPEGSGNFTVEGSSGWYAFGGGSDWFVANNANIAEATKFFKVEATATGVEIKAVDAPDDGFLNDLEEEEEEVEVETEEVGGEGGGKGRGKGGDG